ncbi:t-complex protein 1 subunit alpha [Anaeramoeba flamelloides]|uniref:T-complex protein 1 subunit alpha n=1 Tax=Anaeramoeba flamelloides TaxID=1746091 RepID=A0ABQ8Y7P1_9EUKA|nr:t-complex protein 1 subunit alpha [Anaeramoeba flamelloides]
MPKFIKKAKIALLDFSLKKQKMGLSVHVQVEDPDELEQIRRREMDIPKERIEMLFKAGVNIILTTGSISNDCLKYFERAGAMGVRHCNRSDLVQLSKSVGGKVLLSLVDLNGNESFESSWIGYSDEVKQESVCNSELLIFKSRKKNIQNRSIILRGPNRFMLDEVHRSVNDAISIVSKTLESSKVVPGGGAIEAGLSIYLEKFSRTVGSIEQVAISQFAKSLLVIPKTLAVNSACDSIELVSKLRACHNTGQVKKKPKLLQIGLDLENNKLLNSIKNGIVEPLVLKIKMLKFATEAAITVLRIDEFIELYPEENKGNEKNDEENN